MESHNIPSYVKNYIKRLNPIMMNNPFRKISPPRVSTGMKKHVTRGMGGGQVVTFTFKKIFPDGEGVHAEVKTTISSAPKYVGGGEYETRYSTSVVTTYDHYIPSPMTDITFSLPQTKYCDVYEKSEIGKIHIGCRKMLTTTKRPFNEFMDNVKESISDIAREAKSLERIIKQKNPYPVNFTL